MVQRATQASERQHCLCLHGCLVCYPLRRGYCTSYGCLHKHTKHVGLMCVRRCTQFTGRPLVSMGMRLAKVSLMALMVLLLSCKLFLGVALNCIMLRCMLGERAAFAC